MPRLKKQTKKYTKNAKTAKSKKRRQNTTKKCKKMQNKARIEKDAMKFKRKKCQNA